MPVQFKMSVTTTSTPSTTTPPKKYTYISSLSLILMIPLLLSCYSVVQYYIVTVREQNDNQNNTTTMSRITTASSRSSSSSRNEPVTVEVERPTISTTDSTSTSSRGSTSGSSIRNTNQNYNNRYNNNRKRDQTTATKTSSSRNKSIRSMKDDKDDKVEEQQQLLLSLRTPSQRSEFTVVVANQETRDDKESDDNDNDGDDDDDDVRVHEDDEFQLEDSENNEKDEDNNNGNNTEQQDSNDNDNGNDNGNNNDNGNDSDSEKTIKTKGRYDDYVKKSAAIISDDNDDNDDDEKLKIIWLASYPNSGTSYTMTLIERATNLSTATNYGLEVTPEKGANSVPINSKYPDGPYWEGYDNAKLIKHTIRDLPTNYIVTKTHCGGRCIKCPANEYVVNNVTDFTEQCQKSSSIDTTGHATIHYIATQRIKKIIHLIRNPIDNTVSRFHLERRHFVKKDKAYYEQRYPLNQIGFQQWCTDLDTEYEYAEKQVFNNDKQLLALMKQVPCHAEFYKFAQWHNLLLQSIPQLGDDKKDKKTNTSSIPVLTIHYEKYYTEFNQTATNIFDFVEQKPILPLRPFRELPNYSNHYTNEQLQSIYHLVKYVATAETWELVHHYFDQFAIININEKEK